ncbi:MAG TPA: hypothetical protein PLT91_02155 [Clostridia bacterium]|nr:MAG: hypothetical protein BWX97_01171 [Firmicutes bacterium ADurb.Bin146]HOD94043.1 hypothetical protein [Clostridia bacterium]HQM39027.1 hypothetical protein [Clostridia bacterium]
MNLKASYKYVMYDNKRALLIYSLIIILVTVLLCTVSISWSNGNNTSQIGGMEIASMIFIFVAGLTSFKDNFHMLMQNSVSRKGTFAATILGFVTTSGILSAISIVVILITKLMSQIEKNIISESFFETMYPVHVNKVNSILVLLESFMLYFVMMLAIVGIGYLIGVIFYRLNKGGKVALAIGIPVFFSVFMPVVDVLAFGGRITLWLIRFMDFIFGATAQNPYMAVISFMVIFLISGLLSWVAMRKAPLKA